MHLRCLSQVEVLPREAPGAAGAVAWDKNRNSEAREYIYPSFYTPWLPELHAWARKSFPPGRAVLAGAQDLMARIAAEFRFDKTATSVSTPLLEMFHEKRGVCQDFAHLQIACLRGIGNSGAVCERLPSHPAAAGPGEALRRRCLPRMGSRSTCPATVGWIWTPRTTGSRTTSTLTIGWGRDYGDVSLIRGSLSGGGDHSLFLSVNVEESR